MRTSALRSLWAAVIGSLVALVLLAPTASAHSELESSDPAQGAVLTGAPPAISFTFDEDLLDQGNAITLTALATGERLELGDVAVAGSTVSVDWPESSPAGEFRAAYRVVSADGHPIDGTVTFTVEQAVGAASPVAVEASTPAAQASPIADPGQPDEASAGDESSAVWALAVGAAALVAVAAALVLLRRGR